MVDDGDANTGTNAALDENDDERFPVNTVLPGLSLHALEEGAEWESAFLLIKVRDAEGHTQWAYRTSAPPNREELLGALVVHVELLRRELVDEWE